jgi:hypothetical protein
MKNVFVAGGEVGLNSLISGEIQNLAGAAVMSTTSAATEYQIVRPIPNASTATVGTWATSEVTLGATGAIGDYLEGLEINNADALNAAVYLEDGNVSPVVTALSVSLQGTLGAAVTVGQTQFTLTTPSAVTVTLNQYAGYILSVIYTPTGSAVPVKFLRKIVSHPAYSAVTSLVFQISHALPAGGSPTLSGVTITGTAGQFGCTASTLATGNAVVISGTYGGTGSITGYTDPKTYYIITTNGTTTFTLSATSGGSAIVTTAGTPTGLTYTVPAAWELLPLSAYEVQPFNTPAGSRYIPMGRSSVNGGWKLSVDATAQVVAGGLFS